MGFNSAFKGLRIRHLSHFMKPGDFEHISVIKVLHLVKGVGLLNE
jgi:hypothetical protein